MAGMPEIGSKISLISKADIRYEGKLFTVDPHECTIALASVRSYGTEDREAENPVPPQAQVYEFILFRGSDIKDIRVVPSSNQLPNDPAIVQMTSVPPTMSTSTYQSHGFGLPVLNQMGSSMNQYGNAYNPMASMAPGMGRTIPKQPQSQPISVIDLIGGSRSSTPGLLGLRKSPTIDQGIQVSPPMNKDDKSHQRHTQQYNNQQQNHQQSYNRDSNRSRGNGVIGDRSYNNDRNDYRGNDRIDYRQQRRVNFNSNNQNMGPPGQMRPQGQNMQSNRGGWDSRGSRGNMRGQRGGRGGRNQGPQNYNRGGQQNQQSGNNQKKMLKFEGDYDFDKANTEFEELRSQLAKVKINDTVAESVAKVNGEDKKDDSGNETAIGENDHEEEQQPVYYDKAKSFFDNISCEAVERSKGRSQRTDWRTERKLNSETFGVASARRGGYRGRGGYYNNRGGYRGGGGGNYRSYNRGGQGRPRSNNQSNNRPQVAVSN